jgi:uncharacterized coiled-coil DUF342 family protein
MPSGSYPTYTLHVEDSMNDKQHEPVYRAAADTAHAELREISEMIDQLRARQGQIFAAVEALEQVVNSATSKPVYEMTPRNSQTTQNSQRIVDAKVLNPLEAHIQDALRVATA